jgi:branched-chain amino acid transport system permease protein
MEKHKTWFFFVVLALLCLTPILGQIFFPGFCSLFMHVATYMCIMILLSTGLHIFFGLCGQINFGCNGFYAVGAYLATTLMVHLKIHFFLALPVTIIGSGIVTVIVGFALLRLRHWVLGLGTAAFGVAVFISFRTVAVKYLGGDDGLFIPGLRLLGARMGPLFYYYFILSFAAIGIVAAYFLENSRAGRAMKLIREDDVSARVTGINVDHYLRIGFLLNGIYAGVAGALYAQWNRWVSPASFGLDISMIVLVFVVVGGVGRLSGAVLGTIMLGLLPEILVPFKDHQALIYALVFFLVIRFMTEGLVRPVGSLFNRIFGMKIGSQ